MTRVLHVLDHSWPILDGYCQRSRSIVRAQKAIGIEPTVLTGPAQEFDDRGASETVLDSICYRRTPVDAGLGGRLFRKRVPLLREFYAVRQMRDRIHGILSKGKVDLVHAHSPALCGLAAIQAAKAHKIPVVYEIRSFWEDSAVDQGKTTPGSLRYRLGRLLETYVARRADAVVAISQAILKDMQTRGLSGQKLLHVPNGVDVSRFVPRERDVSLATELGLGDAPTLGYLGTLFPWEGIPWLVRAASQLHRSGINFKLLIVGDGLAAEEVRRTIQECQANAFVMYVGRVPNEKVESFYSVMDVLVYPRRGARVAEMVTPLKPLEAMALGKAVLGSCVGGIRELIDSGVNGMLFQTENAIDFCEKASLLLSDLVLRGRLGHAARQTVVEKRDWSTLARGYETLYGRLVR